MIELPAISLWQPWAHLIAVGEKHFETRSWQTAYRGRMAIHAGRHWTVRMARQCYEEPFFTVLLRAGVQLTSRCDRTNLPGFGFAFGAVVAIADLVECWPTESLNFQACEDSLPPDLIVNLQERAFGDFSHGRYAWEYRNVVRLDQPIPCTGRQGIFRVRYLYRPSGEGSGDGRHRLVFGSRGDVDLGARRLGVLAGGAGIPATAAGP